MPEWQEERDPLDPRQPKMAPNRAKTGHGTCISHTQGIVVVQTRHLMVSYDPRRATPALEQLPSLLAPAGFETRFAANGEEAEVLLDSWTVHVAVVDWAIPLRGEDSPGSVAGGAFVRLLRRREAPPPVIVVRPPMATTRDRSRTLTDALREGVFAVLDRPLHTERLLEVLRRATERSAPPNEKTGHKRPQGGHRRFDP